MTDENQPPDSPESCQCFNAPYANLRLAKEMGMDSRFAELSVAPPSVLTFV